MTILQRELAATHDSLQSTIEELQATNKELQSSNEELQSVNEEMNTVNDEFQEKVLLLNRANADLDGMSIFIKPLQLSESNSTNCASKKD